MTDSASFSERHGYYGADVEITTREDAPEEVRAAILMLGYAAGMGPGGMRDTVCEVLLKRPDPNNWSPGNIENEVHRLIDDAPWYKVYDIAERIHAEIACEDYSGTKQAEYARRLTQFFREHGVGWQMEEGRIVFRGSEAFTLATRDAVAKLILTKTSDEWRPIFAAADCCATVIVPLEEAMRDPHFVERGLFAHQVGTESGKALPALPLPIAPEFRAAPGTKKAPKLG